jgi:NAD(P)-dependent dehydrogenase (short-subunit alcohol dehydrogenase family)
MLRLEGKICLITGAAQGLGLAMAQRLVSEAETIIVCDKNYKTLEKISAEMVAKGGNVIPLKMDVSSESDWQTTSKYIEDNFGRLDVLINNAGVELVLPIEDITLDAWRNVQNINVDGIFLACKSMLNLLKKSGSIRKAGASIVNVSSVAGIVAFANQSAYNTSKGAVRHMSKSLAIEFAEARYNIRVNSIHPGFINTPMLHDVFINWASKGIMGNTVDEVEKAVAAIQPLGHFGQPEDIANGVLFLASDESGFMTGTEMIIDGAWTAR